MISVNVDSGSFECGAMAFLLYIVYLFIPNTKCCVPSTLCLSCCSSQKRSSRECQCSVSSDFVFLFCLPEVFRDHGLCQNHPSQFLQLNLSKTNNDSSCCLDAGFQMSQTNNQLLNIFYNEVSNDLRKLGMKQSGVPNDLLGLKLQWWGLVFF